MYNIYLKVYFVQIWILLSINLRKWNRDEADTKDF